MKKVDPAACFEAFLELLQEGQDVSYPFSGGSMIPFVVPKRDRAFFRAPERPLKPGDIVLYRRESGQYVMHRIIKCAKDGSFTLAGDAQTVLEPGIRPEQIAARVYAVQRKGRLVKESDVLWKLFAGPWRWLLPLRRSMIRLRGAIKK